MLSLQLIKFIKAAEDDLDDMDFTQLFGHDEGLKIFYKLFKEECDSDLIQLIRSLDYDKQVILIDHVNKQFAVTSKLVSGKKIEHGL